MKIELQHCVACVCVFVFVLVFVLVAALFSLQSQQDALRCAALWLCSVQRCLQYTLNCNFNLFSMNCTSSFPSSSLSFTHSLSPFALFCCTTWRMRYILRVTYSNIETATCPHALLCNFNVAIAVRHCYCCCCLCYCCCSLCFCCC